MQSVSDRWYIWYSRISLTIATLLTIAWVIKQLAIQVLGPIPPLNVGYLPLFLALVQIFYIFLIYRRQVENASFWQATVIILILQILMILSLAQTADKYIVILVISWLILVFFSNIFGPIATIGTCAASTIYFISISTVDDGSLSVNQATLISLICTHIVGLVGYFTLRRYYLRSDDSRIIRLSSDLRKKQIQSEILVKSITDGVVLTDTEGNITTMNIAAANMTGWSIEESIGLNVHNIITLKDQQNKILTNIQNPFDNVLLAKKALSGTYLLETREKNNRTVSCVVSPIITDKTNNILGTVAVLRDISAEKAEEQRRADFISTASHEMRTPVAAIEGYLALALNDKVSTIDDKARSYLDKAHSSTQHLGQLFQDLLTSAKAEDGRLTNHPVVVDVGIFMEQVADSLRFSAEKKGLLVDFTIGTDSSSRSGKVLAPLYYCHIDPDRIREVVTNLFDNAVKYTETGKISIGLTGNEEVVQIFIKDTGPGIPKDDIPHLFQKFYRVDNTTTRTVGGTGLGLFICKKIVELYKGRLWVESETGKGSTFYINLPRISSQKAKELQASEVNASTIR
ncbi:MAG: ATP-binding protein [Candidatus Saccharimonadales bacterium]